jgi:hypothetical protein
LRTKTVRFGGVKARRQFLEVSGQLSREIFYAQEEQFYEDYA